MPVKPTSVDSVHISCPPLTCILFSPVRNHRYPYSCIFVEEAAVDYTINAYNIDLCQNTGLSLASFMYNLAG
jgi:hypothetical protein